jgi:hypothetical protein
MTETIDITPSWRTAVSIYIHVLRNQDASSEAVEAAKADLLRLADEVERLQTIVKTLSEVRDIEIETETS